MIESDFLREYRIDLAEELPRGLSARRFFALLAGLSPNSAYVNLMVSKRKDEVITDPEEGERYINSMI